MLTELMENPSTATVFVVFMWVGLAVLVFVKQEWFFRFDERFPRLDVFDMSIVTEAGKIGFMIGRFIFIFIVAYVIGTFIRLIFG